MQTINSPQNTQIKKIKILKKSRERKAQGLILVEGQRELGLALEQGLEIINLFFTPEFFNEGGKDLYKTLKNKQHNILSKELFQSISYRENPDGVLAILKNKEQNIADFKFKKNPLILVLESVEKPGNLGAIIRTADASGVDAIIVNDLKTDIYNPNIIRASQGTVFTTTIFNLSQEETLEVLQKNKIKTYAAALQDSKNYLDYSYKNSSAFIFGDEALGLGKFWRKNADEIIKINMQGKIDSLNVSVSTAVLIFEAVRQRRLL